MTTNSECKCDSPILLPSDKDTTMFCVKCNGLRHRTFTRTERILSWVIPIGCVGFICLMIWLAGQGYFK